MSNPIPVNIPRIAAKVWNEPWLIQPETHRAIRQLLHSKMAGDPVADSRINDTDPRTGQRVDFFEFIGDGVARVVLDGVIGKKMSLFETMCGGACLDRFTHALGQVAADANVHTVVLDIDSPGGTVTGVPEAARAIAALADSGRLVVGFAENLCASAGYWLASQCDEIFATGSATVGSIGVYMAWLDHTEAMERAGVRLELFEAGEHKAIGMRPPTDAEREIFQAEVDAIHLEFKSAVWSRRPDVPESAMEGLTYDGNAALALGLVDSVTDSFDAMLDELGLTWG